MKNSAFPLSVAFLFGLSFPSVQRHATFNGHVHYTVIAEGAVNELVTPYLFHSFDIFTKNQKLRVDIDGETQASLPDQILYSQQKNKYFGIFIEQRKAVALLPSKWPAGTSERIFKPTGDEAEVLGYDCQEYRASWEENGIQVEESVWVAPIPVPAVLGDVPLPLFHHFGNASWNGLPLVIEISLMSDNLDQQISIIADKIEPMKLKKDFFKIPKGFATD